MRLRHLLPLLVLLGACASNWKLVAEREQPALKEGAKLVTLERGRGTEDVERVRRGYEDRIERVRAEAITDRQRTENEDKGADDFREQVGAGATDGWGGAEHAQLRCGVGSRDPAV